MTSPHDPISPGPSIADEQLLERLRAATHGEYEIHGELGRGGMAIVYLAHEIALDRKVAIKVLFPGLLHGAGMVERFKREARTSANLSHPNIIPIYAVREVDGLLFFVMKLVEGTPLDSIIKELGKLPFPMVEAILAQVGGAFGYAHRHGVIHRDIKPSNILIDDEGWAVVTDFGIAKVQETEGLTLTGVAVGTPTYMSPEQCGGGPITGASDQYALGIVAYEMLAGRAPFASAGMMALMYSHFHENVPPLELYRPDCPEPIRQAIMRMLEKDPANRFPSLEEAVVALGARQLAHDDPTRSQLILLARSGSTHKVVSQVQTPRSPVPMITRARKVTSEAPVAGAPPSDHRWKLLAVGAVALAVIAVGVLLFRPDGNSGSIDSPIAVAPPPAPVPQPPAQEVTPPPAPPAPAPAPAATRPPADNRETARSASPSGRNPVTPPSPAPAPPPTATPAPAPAPAPAPPPAPEPTTRPAPETTPANAAKPVDERAEVSSAIQAYARAFDQGDLAQVRRIFPGIPSETYQNLEAFWKAGGTMRTRWTVSEVVVTGDTATARISGSNSVTPPRARPSDQPVSWRARLERRGTEWRIVSLVN